MEGSEEMRGHRIAGTCLMVLLAIALGGCTPPERFTTYAHPRLSMVRPEKIGVLPFFKGRHPAQPGQTLNCPLGMLWFDKAGLVPGAEDTLTRMAHEAMVSRFGGKVESLDHSIAVWEGLPRDEATDTPLTIGRRAGQKMGVDLVLVGSVWRYRERTGGPAATWNPASVAFELYLVDVRTGEALWIGGFDETQKSLSENIWDLGTFMERGARWLTANELARFGMRELVAQIPLKQ